MPELDATREVFAGAPRAPSLRAARDAPSGPFRERGRSRPRATRRRDRASRARSREDHTRRAARASRRRAPRDASEPAGDGAGPRRPPPRSLRRETPASAGARAASRRAPPGSPRASADAHETSEKRPHRGELSSHAPGRSIFRDFAEVAAQHELRDVLRRGRVRRRLRVNAVSCVKSRRYASTVCGEARRSRAQIVGEDVTSARPSSSVGGVAIAHERLYAR